MTPPDSYQSLESEPPESSSPANELPPAGVSSSSSPRIHDLPEDERPREKMAARGPQALTDAELLAIFLGTGTVGKSAIDVGRDLLRDFDSLTGLSRRSLTELRKVKGIWFAKAVNLSATF